MPSGRKHITAVLEEDEAREFIHGGKGGNARPVSRATTTQPATKRRKMSIRLPEDLDDILSRVRLERVLANRNGQLPAGQPCEKQEILADALRDWLAKHGYLAEQA
jgi:hypothetical protein